MADLAGARDRAARSVTWAGAGVFAVSLAYFLFTYGVTFREIAAGPVRWIDVGFNVALFSLFSLHHSVFARPAARAWIARHVTPRLERSVYVWIASLMLILVCALWRPIGGVAWQVTGPAVWLPRALLLAGVWLTLRSAAIIDVWELAGVTARRPTGTRKPKGLRLPDASARLPKPEVGGLQASDQGIEPPTVFSTDGPYGWVRHPIYAGWFLIVFSVTPMTMTRLVFALVSCAYILAAIPLEERTLRNTSEGAYDRYARRVRWKLMPGVY